MAKTTFQISEAAKAVGLNPRTIRYYERRGLLKAARTLSGYRVFGEEELIRLKLVKQLRRLGFSIVDTHQVLPILVNASPRSQRTHALKRVLTRRLAAAAEHLRELTAAHQELQERLAALSSKRMPARDRCCEPFCGPQTCGPGLVQIRGLTRPSRKGGGGCHAEDSGPTGRC